MRILNRLSLSSSSLAIYSGFNKGCKCRIKGFHSTSNSLQNVKGEGNRQAKIFQKLFGTRKSGNKKRWIPTSNERLPTSSDSIIATPSNISQIKNGGKNANRRINVLNKLFMQHITDLMATGEASEEIIGKGVQISRVKVTPDFHGVNVYWICKGTSDDAIVETILNKSSGIIRHELSQLRLMGEVPRIRFVKDKSYAGLQEIDAILKNCDLGTEDDYVKYDVREQTKNELNLESCEYTKKEKLIESMTEENENENKEENEFDELLPVMRHDVLGLNHKDIMSKILTKMKKSKEAWNLYDQQTIDDQEPIKGSGKELEKLKQKLEASKLKEKEFEKFLMRKKYEKNTPKRGKYSKYEEELLFDRQQLDIDDGQPNRTEDEGDFIEEIENNK